MNISERVRAVIETEISARKRATQIESRTGISSETWRKFLNGQQNATANMIQAVAREWPEYAFWIATGITDTVHGHIGPEVAYQDPVNWKRLHSPAAAVYFRTKLHQQHGEESLDSADDFLPQNHVGPRHSSAGYPFQFAKEELEFKNADDLQQLRMHTDHFRFTDEGLKYMASKMLRYGE